MLPNAAPDPVIDAPEQDGILRESLFRKKSTVEDEGFGGSEDSLETFLDRLRNLHPNHGGCDGKSRLGQIEDQARLVGALARELGIFKQPDSNREEVVAIRGSERWVEFSSEGSLAVKVTIPSGFGLTSTSPPFANRQSA